MIGNLDITLETTIQIVDMLLDKEIKTFIEHNNQSHHTGVVYVFVEEITGKMYVGMTMNIEQRLKNHIWSCAANYDNNKSKFYNYVRKYGWKYFKLYFREINLTQKEAYEREILWISKLDTFYNGLNSTTGGEGCGCGPEHPDAISIKLLDIDSNEEFHFDWIGAAALFLGVSSSNISRVISSKYSHRQIYNSSKQRRFAAKLLNDTTSWDTTILPKGAHNKKSIILMNLDTKKSIVFDSILGASKWLGVHKNNVSTVLNHRNQVYDKDETNRYAVQLNPPILDWDFSIPKLKTPVVSYDMHNKFIARYDSMSEAAGKTSTNVAHISDCAHHKRHTAGGFVWELEDVTLREAQPPRASPYNSVYTIINGEKLTFSSVCSAAKNTLGINKRRQIEKSIRDNVADCMGNFWHYTH